MAKLTQTQINAICDRLRKKYNPSTGKVTQRKEEANLRVATAEITKLKLPAPFKAYIIGGLQDYLDYDNDGNVLKAFPNLPHPELFEDGDVQTQVNEIVDELKFELTMAGVEGYKAAMAAAEKKLSALM